MENGEVNALNSKVKTMYKITLFMFCVKENMNK